MKALLLTAAGGAAVVAAAFSRTPPQDARPVNPNPPVVVETRTTERTRAECPNPCQHCSITPPATEPAPETPRRRRERPADPAVDQPATGDAPAGTPARGMIVQGTVITPDGKRYVCSAPLPSNPDEFTWRRFQGRASPTPILGLHVYAPRREPGLVVGTVRFSNAAVNPDGTGFCGAVYYDSFTLTAPAGWEWVTLPTKGQAVNGGVWVVVAAPQNDDNFARPRSMLEWPYALVRAGDDAARARADAALRYQDLAIPTPVTDYGPARTLLPTVDRVKYGEIASGWASQLLTAQASGSKVWIDNIADVQNAQLGPYWMDGSTWGYAHGGYGIDPTAAAPEQVPQAVLARAIMHRANVARSFMGAFNASTGKPIGLYEWTSPPGTALMSGEAGMEGQVELVPFLTGDYYTYHYPRFNTGKCSYEYGRTTSVGGTPTWIPGLWDYEEHDIAHSIRAMRNAIALVEYARDPAARDFLLMVAESNRYGWFSDRPDEVTPKKNPHLGYYPQTFTLQLERIDEKPSQGAWIDRNWAWAAFAGACAIEYEPDPARRATWISWGRKMVEGSVKAADKFGFAGRNFSPGNLPDTVSGVQTFHEMLVLCHRVTLAMRVYDGALPPSIAEVNTRALRSALATLLPRPYGGAIGPPHWIGTADNNVELAALSESYAYGEGDPAHVWAACAMTYRANPASEEALQLSLRHWYPAADLSARLAGCKQLVPNKSWSCELESVLQQRNP